MICHTWIELLLFKDMIQNTWMKFLMNGYITPKRSETSILEICIYTLMYFSIYFKLYMAFVFAEILILECCILQYMYF